MTNAVQNIQILPEQLHQKREFLMRITVTNPHPWNLTDCILHLEEYDNCMPFFNGLSAFVLEDIAAGKSVTVDLPFTTYYSEIADGSITVGFESVVENTARLQNVFGKESNTAINPIALKCSDSKKIDFNIIEQHNGLFSKNLRELAHIFE